MVTQNATSTAWFSAGTTTTGAPAKDGAAAWQSQASLVGTVPIDIRQVDASSGPRAGISSGVESEYLVRCTERANGGGGGGGGVT